MSRRTGSSYQTDHGLESAVVDLVRVGARGHGAGVRQLAARLLRSVPAGVTDDERFRDAVHQAMAASSSGTELRYLAGSVPTEKDSAQPLVDVDSAPDGGQLVVAPAVIGELNEVVLERGRADELRRAGVGLTRSLLLSGPPGVGKTMAARWLAQELDLPLVALDLASVVSSYLGSSGRNIKTVLDYGKSGPCVLLLDEFDAIAKRRDDESDIGELKRIVNVVLVELDHWPDTSLLVAATNHPQLLDPAVERRFDRSIEFPLPGASERREMVRHLSAGAPGVTETIAALVTEVTDGLSGSDLTRFWTLTRRKSILRQADFEQTLVLELARQFGTSAPARDRLFLALSQTAGLSNRQIAATMGVSHPTVASGIKRAEGAHRGEGKR